MNHALVAAAGLACLGGAAAACPDPSLADRSAAITPTYDIQRIPVTAGGEQTLQACGLGVVGIGQFRSAPDVSLDVPQMEQRQLRLAVESTCDPALLITTADGQWLFNDDADGLNPGLVIEDPAALMGRIDIWVGTFAGTECEATLALSTEPLGTVPEADVSIPTPSAAAPSAAAPSSVDPSAPVPEDASGAATGPEPAPLPTANCPDPTRGGPPITLAAEQIAQPQAYSLSAMGSDTMLSACPAIPGAGTATVAPQTSLFLTGMQGQDVMLSVRGDCDTTLLAADADGGWYFDDDSAGNLQPRLFVPSAALNGRLDLWVGTFEGDTCAATLTLQAVAAGTTSPQPVPLSPGDPALSCPDATLQGIPVTTTGDALSGPDTFETTASGSGDLGACGLPGVGFAEAAPNFTLFLSGMRRFGQLEIQVGSACDTTLLVRDAFGVWHFDDDSRGGLSPRLNLTDTAGLEGRVDVWVGTFDGSQCPARVEFRTR